MSGEIMHCDMCGREIITYDDVGYDGPVLDDWTDPDEESSECSPFLEWATVCLWCAEKGFEGVEYE